ncbi:MAG: hypothetical protein VXW98_07330, partial [Actinomycetota bacterium]|nr:hypothetical protein [Actinomycetota bacterium]
GSSSRSSTGTATALEGDMGKSKCCYHSLIQSVCPIWEKNLSPEKKDAERLKSSLKKCEWPSGEQCGGAEPHRH